MLRIKSVLEVLYDCMIFLLDISLKSFCMIFLLLFYFLKYGCWKEKKRIVSH